MNHWLLMYICFGAPWLLTWAIGKYCAVIEKKIGDEAEQTRNVITYQFAGLRRQMEWANGLALKEAEKTNELLAAALHAGIFQ